ncbi:hypothetical protein E2562_007825 [Oryza meyeriana var. granulata]|uniref:Uncharacterized protein n=1 Tax=Oryza meyeriana var. granulata TaxID=110450 RepID=A0A6G1F525_9ORYZ|nr:hypothetical protein E2562_007825 [Oryza meyeriana var. granulata]
MPTRGPRRRSRLATVEQMVILSEEGDEEDNNFDMDDEMSVSMPSDDENQGEGTGEVAQVQKTKRGVKRVKCGVSLSPTKCKVKRVKRADCWKFFKVIQVQSKKEFGVMVSKAKCRSSLKPTTVQGEDDDDIEFVEFPTCVVARTMEALGMEAKASLHVAGMQDGAMEAWYCFCKTAVYRRL